MTKRLTKSERTERKCLYCETLFTPKKGASKGFYCSKTCSSTANGLTFGRHNYKTINLRRGSNFTSNEEHDFYINDFGDNEC